MTEQQKVAEIVAKYNRSIFDLSENGIVKELKTVFNYFAMQANKRQRELVGLDD